MSLFEKAGERYEETKQSLVGSKQPKYVCQSCEKSVSEAYEHCPHCGEGPVEPVEED